MKKIKTPQTIKLSTLVWIVTVMLAVGFSFSAGQQVGATTAQESVRAVGDALGIQTTVVTTKKSAEGKD